MSRLRPPINDAQCLGQLYKRAVAEAGSPAARLIANRVGSVHGLVAWMRSLPQLDDDGSSTEGIACDVKQRLRSWPRDPNCFERTAMGLAVLEHLPPLHPTDTYSPVTFQTSAGRHTTVAVTRASNGTVTFLDLAPRATPAYAAASALRNASTGQRVFQGFHTAGKAILRFYGLGFAVEPIERLERRAGLLPPEEKFQTEEQGEERRTHGEEQQE